MSPLLHILAKLIVYAVLGVIVVTLMIWITRNKSDQSRTPSLGELPDDKATRINRISAQRPYSSSRRDLKDEQEKRRA